MQYLAILVIAALAVVGAWWSMSTKSVDMPAAQAPITQPVTESAPAPLAPSMTYKNGTYSSKGEYSAPSGSESIDVKLTLVGGAITEVSVKGNATNKASVSNQERFIAGVQKAVVGKSIDTLALGVVNGASLTPKGFNDAIAKIKAQAK